MNTFKRRIKFALIVSICLLVGCVFLVQIFWWPDHTLFFIESKSYAIDPNTILEELNQGNSDVFILEGDYLYENMRLKKSDPVQWSQDDYYRIAQAANEEAWAERNEDWNLTHILIAGECATIHNGIKDISFRFFRIDGEIRYDSLITITPQENEVDVYKEKHDPYRGKPKALIYDELAMSGETAFQIAEESGGKDIRDSVEDSCYFLISYSPNGWDYGDGWKVDYIGSNEEFLGRFRINLKTGELEQ